MQPIRFNRKPYTVTYKDLHTDELVQVKRRPPAKVHDILPTDIVELKHRKGSEWEEGEEYQVKHISYRAPNVVQLMGEDGGTTFVPSHDLELTEEVAYRAGRQIDDERANRYLTWP